MLESCDNRAGREGLSGGGFCTTSPQARKPDPRRRGHDGDNISQTEENRVMPTKRECHPHTGTVNSPASAKEQENLPAAVLSWSSSACANRAAAVHRPAESLFPAGAQRFLPVPDERW